jgi:hypothetical protein
VVLRSVIRQNDIEDQPRLAATDPRDASILAGAVPARGPELPADLEGDGGLAGAGRHGDQQAPPASENALDHAIDGNLLVVALPLADRIVERREEPGGDALIGQAPGRAVALPQLLGRRIVGPSLFQPSGVVELDDLLPVGRIGELKPQHLGVGLGLLQPIGSGAVSGLGLDDGKRKIASVAQQIVHTLRRLPDEPLAHRDDPPIRDRPLLGDGMGLLVPASGLKPRDDLLTTRVSFVHSARRSALPGSRGPVLSAPYLASLISTRGSP